MALKLASSSLMKRILKILQELLRSTQNTHSLMQCSTSNCWVYYRLLGEAMVSSCILINNSCLNFQTVLCNAVEFVYTQHFASSYLSVRFHDIFNCRVWLPWYTSDLKEERFPSGLSSWSTSLHKKAVKFGEIRTKAGAGGLLWGG